MDKEFIGKKIEIISAFSYAMHEGGAAPIVAFGRLVDVDENFYKVEVEKSRLGSLSVLGSNDIGRSGLTLFRKQYVISIKLMDF